MTEIAVAPADAKLVGRHFRRWLPDATSSPPLMAASVWLGRATRARFARGQVQ